MGSPNRGAILCELQQLVNEIDNNNFVAKRLYDMVEAKEPETSRNTRPEILLVPPLVMPLAPHYHMSELIAATIELVVDIVERFRQLMGKILTIVCGKPVTRSIAVQSNCRLLSAATAVPLKLLNETRNVLPHIDPPDLDQFLGPNSDVDVSDTSIYRGGKSTSSYETKGREGGRTSSGESFITTMASRSDKSFDTSSSTATAELHIEELEC